MTEKQRQDLETIEYFIPKALSHINVTDKDRQMFLEYSERGLHKDKIKGSVFASDFTGLDALCEGKRWRGVHMRMYEEGVLEGTMPYFTILGGYDKTVKRKWLQFWKPRCTHVHVPIPRTVVDFMKKEMFKGIDAEIIENCYNHCLALNSII
jgi:hypothetical protein